MTTNFQKPHTQPKAERCWFCRFRDSEPKFAIKQIVATAEVSKIAGKTDGAADPTTQMEVDVPRCQKCARLHSIPKAIQYALFLPCILLFYFSVAATERRDIANGNLIMNLMYGNLVLVVVAGILARLFIEIDFPSKSVATQYAAHNMRNQA